MGSSYGVVVLSVKQTATFLSCIICRFQSVTTGSPDSTEARIAAGTVTCQLRTFCFQIKVMGAQNNVICFQN